MGNPVLEYFEELGREEGIKLGEVNGVKLGKEYDAKK